MPSVLSLLACLCLVQGLAPSGNKMRTPMAARAAATGPSLLTPLAARAAATGPSTSFLLVTLTFSDLAAPCRRIDWVFRSGAMQILRFALAAALHIVPTRVVLFSVDDGDGHQIVGDSPFLDYANAATTSPFVDLSACFGAPAVGAVGDLLVAVRALGDGTNSSLAALSATLSRMNAADFGTLFRLRVDVQISSLSIRQALISGPTLGALELTGSGEAGGGSIRAQQPSTALIAGAAAAAVAGAALVVGGALRLRGLRRARAQGSHAEAAAAWEAAPPGLGGAAGEQPPPVAVLAEGAPTGAPPRHPRAPPPKPPTRLARAEAFSQSSAGGSAGGARARASPHRDMRGGW